MSRSRIGQLAVVMFVASVACGVYEYSVTWTADQQHDDPAGYIAYLLRSVQQDAGALRQYRKRLQEQHVRLCERQQQLERQVRTAASSALELRERFHSGEPRVLALGQMWTRDQLESQISSLLAEVEQGTAALGVLQSSREDLELELERRTTELTDSDAAISMLQAQRELAVSRGGPRVSLEQLRRQVEGLTGGRGISAEPEFPASLANLTAGLD